MNQSSLIPDMPPAEYHADPCPAPSLSSGVARKLLSQSPQHAMLAHPRLTPDRVPVTPSAAMEEGTILHGLVLGDDVHVHVIDAPDWRTKAAQTERDEARAFGAIPILVARHAELQACADAALTQIRQHEIAADMDAGRPEATMLWQDGPVWCRSRIDWLPHDPRAPLYDLKTTSQSAHPDAWSRKLFASGYDLQAALYMRGSEVVRGVRPAGFRFIVLETVYPFALSIVQMAPDAEALAHARLQRALHLWSDCLTRGEWPGYPDRVCHVNAPTWAHMEFEEQEMRQ